MEAGNLHVMNEQKFTSTLDNVYLLQLLLLVIKKH